MAKQLLVDDKDIPAMLEFYAAKRSNVAKDITLKQQELDSIDRMISQLNNSVSTLPTQVKEVEESLPGQVSGSYPFDKTWVDKIKYVVTELRSATTSEIVDRLLFYEPTYKPRRKTLVPTISGKLSDNAGEGGMFNRTKKNGHFEYSMA